MRVSRSLLAAGLALAWACGSEPTAPGTITITLNQVPALTNAGTIQVTGTVTRTPAEPDQPLVVTATTGATSVTDTATAGGAFTLAVALASDVVNDITVSATDPSGSTSTPVMVSVQHDGQPPTVSTITPADQSDGVTPTNISVVFSEPVVPGTPTMAVTLQGGALTGTGALSADSLTFTFTPDDPFLQNVIYSVVLGGARDAAGNMVGGAVRCFVTGGAGIATFNDPSGDIFVLGSPPASFQPPDVLQIRFARTSDALLTVVRFSGPRSGTAGAGNRVSMLLDLDTDQDGNTGFASFKDTVFTGILANSGARVEATIEFGSLIGTASDSAFVGQYTGPTDLNGAEFVPSLCGPFLGLATPFSFLGDADGAFNAVGYFEIFDETIPAGYADPAPDTGFFMVGLPAPSPAVAAALPAALLRGIPFTRGSTQLARRQPARSIQ